MKVFLRFFTLIIFVFSFFQVAANAGPDEKIIWKDEPEQQEQVKQWLKEHIYFSEGDPLLLENINQALSLSKNRKLSGMNRLLILKEIQTRIFLLPDSMVLNKAIELNRSVEEVFDNIKDFVYWATKSYATRRAGRIEAYQTLEETKTNIENLASLLVARKKSFSKYYKNNLALDTEFLRLKNAKEDIKSKINYIVRNSYFVHYRKLALIKKHGNVLGLIIDQFQACNAILNYIPDFDPTP